MPLARAWAGVKPNGGAWGGGGVPKTAKPAEPFPVQPGAWGAGRSILAGHQDSNGGFRLVDVEGATLGNQLD